MLDVFGGFAAYMSDTNAQNWKFPTGFYWKVKNWKNLKVMLAVAKFL